MFQASTSGSLKQWQQYFKYSQSQILGWAWIGDNNCEDQLLRPNRNMPGPRRQAQFSHRKHSSEAGCQGFKEEKLEGIAARVLSGRKLTILILQLLQNTYHRIQRGKEQNSRIQWKTRKYLARLGHQTINICPQIVTDGPKLPVGHRRRHKGCIKQPSAKQHVPELSHPQDSPHRAFKAGHKTARHQLLAFFFFFHNISKPNFS